LSKIVGESVDDRFDEINSILEEVEVILEQLEPEIEPAGEVPPVEMPTVVAVLPDTWIELVQQVRSGDFIRQQRKLLADLLLDKLLDRNLDLDKRSVFIDDFLFSFDVWLNDDKKSVAVLILPVPTKMIVSVDDKFKVIEVGVNDPHNIVIDRILDEMVSLAFTVSERRRL
jgi:hypothetical protein